MEKTANLGLNKPSYADVCDIEKLNENFDVLDREIPKIKNASYDMANLDVQPGVVYKVVKSGTEVQPVYTETVSKAGKELAKRVMTQNTNGTITIVATSADYGINARTLITQTESTLTAEVS